MNHETRTRTGSKITGPTPPHPDAQNSADSVEDDRSGEIFSITQAFQSAGENLDVLKQLVAIIQDDLPKRLTGLREAISAQDGIAAGRHAHTIRGQAVHFRAQRLVDLSETLETMAQEGRFGQIDELLPEFLAAADRLLSWFPALDWEEVEKIVTLDLEEEA